VAWVSLLKRRSLTVPVRPENGAFSAGRALRSESGSPADGSALQHEALLGLIPHCNVNRCMGTMG